jgi:transposase-like protein
MLIASELSSNRSKRAPLFRSSLAKTVLIPCQLSQWRRRYRAGKLRGMDRGAPISELGVAKRRIRELERELERKAFENAMLREAIEFAHLPASARRKAPSP